MTRVPRIKSVIATGNTELLVHFDNSVAKTYDCKPLLARPEFHLLRVPAFFRAVKVDAGGYGVSWNDDLDLSEYELWTNGKPPLAESPNETDDHRDGNAERHHRDSRGSTLHQ